MSNVSNHDFGMRTFCFFFGATMGAAAALLMAPQSGRRTRRKIRRKIGEGREYLHDTGEEIIGRGREIYDRSKEFVGT